MSGRSGSSPIRPCAGSPCWTELDDLAVLPGNRLEALPGERAGQHSIRINAERRICFRWASDGPHDVEIVDDRSVGEGRGP